MPDLAVDAPRERATKARRIGIAVFVVLVVAPLVTVAVSSTRLFTPGGRTLEVEISATGGRWAEIFWSSTYALSAQDSSLVVLHQRPGQPDTLRFPLPPKPLEILRFDPLDGEGEVVIRRMQVLDDRGRVIRTIDPMVLTPLNQIAFMKPGPEGVRVKTTAGANDPMLVARGSWFAEPPRWYSLQFVTPFSLSLVVLAVVALVATGLAIVVWEVRAGPIAVRDVLWFGALFLALLWAKLSLLEHHPVPVPFWDQWDGEGLTLYIPWADQGLSWRQMFTFHNEHRIFFSRLLALSVLVSNGQWDPHLQIVVNAALDALVGLLLAAMLWLAMQRRNLPGIVLAVGLAFAPPFALENSLAGFQSAFYFLLLFSCLALWLMGTSRAGTARWLAGCLFALCCPFTVAGGILILPAIAVAMALGAVRERWGWRTIVVGLLGLAIVAAVGYGALPPPISYHQGLKANSVRFFEIAFARSLAFPWINYPRATVLMWLPLGAVGVGILLRRLRATAIEQLTIALGIWVVLQCAAVAYSRGANGAAPASRYLDMVAIGYLANTAAILAWLKPSQNWRLAGAVAVALALWIGVTAVGIRRVSYEMLAIHAPQRRAWTREHTRNVRSFVQTGDVTTFLTLRGPQDIPYYSASMLAGWLEHPYIRRILPAAVRQPLDVRSAGATVSTAAAAPTAGGAPQPVFDSYASSSPTGEARFESQAVTCKDLHRVRFEVASSSSWSGLHLFLHTAGSTQETTVGPPWFDSGGWSSITVRCPATPFTIVAEDSSPQSWFAFRAPAEVALGSSVAESLVQQSRFVGFTGAALALLALLSTARAWRGGAG